MSSTLSSYLRVSPAVWGVMKTRGWRHSGLSAGSGSSTVTSSAAAERRPDASAASSAASFTTLPRAQFTRMAPGFIAPSRAPSIRLVVSGVSGQTSSTASARGSTCGSASSPCTSSAPSVPAEGSRRMPITVISSAFSSRISRAPMRPVPTTTAVLPASSSSRMAKSAFMPDQCCRPWSSRAVNRLRVTPSSSASACSLTAAALPPAAEASLMPCWAKTARSYWSVPALSDCTRRSFGARAGSVLRHSPLTTSTSASAMRASSSGRERTSKKGRGAPRASQRAPHW